MKSIALILLFVFSVFAQTQTTGRIAGTVKDQNDAFLAGATVTITSQATGGERVASTDGAGNFAVAFLAPGVYRVRIAASGFNVFSAEAITVGITETTSVNVVLTIAGVVAETSVNSNGPLIKTDSATLGQVINERTINELPLATRNFTQLLGLTAGTASYLTDNTVVGRNSQNVSVNGSRVSQNNFQINGIDASAGIGAGLPLANPAPESVAEFKIQTSLYDATFGGAGGGNVQIITKSGSNKFSGAIYDYLRNTALTANSPFLKAIGSPRPVLERNVFGLVLGGTIKKDRAFFFGSYQTTRERNGASRLNSLSRNVLIAPGLTHDRSEARLLNTFGVPFIHPTALMMLNARLPNGRFLIPTPQSTNGRYSGSAISRFREEQFNANFDYRFTQNNWLSVKFFFSNAPTTLARRGGINVPGFAVEQKQDNRLASIQDIHIFSSNITNEARIGYNFVRGDNFPQQPFGNVDFGIQRSTASYLPGFPHIRIGLNAGAGALIFGTGINQDQQTNAPTTSFADTVSITRGRHHIRFGAEFRYYEFNTTFNFGNRGLLDFQTFNDFLIGDVMSALLFNGITDRALRTTDYNFFVQNDWRFSTKLMLNLGLRYELDLPPYDSRGRISTFDPSLYRPRPGGGAPLGGIVQAGNPIAQYDLPDVPNVGKRVLKSIDPNNFAPRVGIAYSPFKSNRIVARAGYGLFYSRPSFQHLVNNMYLLPFYFINQRTHLDVSNPFPPLPDQFPILNFGTLMFGNSFDRNNRTPYIQQYNGSLQFGLSSDTMLEAAYVGTRGMNLYRRVAINQARLASTDRPIVNAATGAIITTNDPGNARLRAPFPGIAITNFSVAGFNQEQASAQSTYNSLQMSLTRRLTRGLQFLASYTYAKSIDNASGTGGGASTNGLIDTTDIGDSAFFPGNQLDNRANRGVSDFDRRHRFVLSFVWDFPQPAFAKRSKIGRFLFSGWQTSGIVTAMSGLPIDVVDGNAGTFYFGADSGGSRPNWVPGESATSNIPPGYYFNPYAFARPFVQVGQIIPSSGGWATAAVRGTDFGNVGRNVVRGPRQLNTDFSVSKRFRIDDAKNIELRAEFFNLFNTVNYANPISNLAAVNQTAGAGSIDVNTGQILPGRAGDFGKIISTSNNPRLIQVAVKFDW